MNTIDKTQLSNKELMIFNQEVENRKKNPVVAYLIWWFLGFTGGHRYYFKKTQSAVAMTLIFWLGVWIFGLGAIITVIWSLVDVFSIGSWLREDTQRIEAEVFAELQGRGALTQPVNNVATTPTQVQTPTPMTVQTQTTTVTPASTSTLKKAAQPEAMPQSVSANASLSESSSLSLSASQSNVATQTAHGVMNQPKPRFCNQCGAKLVEGAEFCTKCGFKLTTN